MGAITREGSKASPERLTRLVLVIAVAYTCAALRGQKIKRVGQQKYVSLLKELQRPEQRHSNFWVGLYGQMWLIGWEFCRVLIEQLMNIYRNKLPFYQRGIQAMYLIQLAS